MSPSNHDPDLLERIAVFRHALIVRLLVPEHDRHERAVELERILATEHDIPGTTRTRIADSTLRDWIRSYRAGGFDALKPKARIDTGDSRALDPQAIEALLAIKEAEPQLSIRATIKLAREQGTIEPAAKVAHSTVHRLFQRHGLGGRGRHRDAGTDRRRFAFAEPGQLWMSDVMYGPGVMIGGRRRRAYLIALIDDATRVITHAEFASSESLRAFLPVMRRALLRRGVPERLYVDNGAAFRAHQLSLICARLNIALIHSRPYQPAGKGKIERFFRTVRAQLLPTLTDEDTTSLEAINRRLAGWIEGEYHRQPHRGLEGDTPLDRFSAGVASLRFPDNDRELDELFLFEAKRKVNSDRTVSLEGRLYEIDAALIGEKVTLRYDPARPTAPITVVHEGAVVERARLVDAYANCFVKRDRRTGVTEADSAAKPSKGLSFARLGDTDTDTDKEDRS